MPRPPKHVRDALKASGEWDFEPSPPPFDPVAAFCAGPDELQAIPGAYEPFFDPTEPPPPAYFENGPLFGDMPEDAEAMLRAECPNVSVFQSMSWDGETLASQILAAAYATAAIQTAAAHDGVGLGSSRLTPHTRFSVKLPECFSRVVESLGEFVGPDDRKWFYRDFPSQTDALARSAHWLLNGVFSPAEVRAHYWLPTRVDDGRTATIFAVGLHKYFLDRGFQIPESELVSAVFSGDVPPTVSAIARQLPREEFSSLLTVFQVYSSDREFLSRYSTGPGSRALGLLGLEWDRPNRRDMMFHLSVTDVVEHVLYMWKSSTATIEKGLDVTMRLVNFRDMGDPWQVTYVRDRPGGVEILTHYSISKTTANFRAVFGSSLVYTSVPMKTRAVGRINPRLSRVAILRDHLGVNGV